MKTANELSAVLRVFADEALLAFELELFGDYIAKRDELVGYSGLEAVHVFIVKKFGWLPSAVRAMNYADLHLAVADEISKRPYSKAAHAVRQKYIDAVAEALPLSEQP